MKYTVNASEATTCTDSSSQVHSHFICNRVPSHLRSTHWLTLLTKTSSEVTHELVLHESDIKKVLSKLERSDFIHTYIPTAAAASSPSLLFELPRYSLDFELQQGQLVSLDHRGYCLAQQQQLVTAGGGPDSNTAAAVTYTLPGFHQYLLLQRIPSSAVEVGTRRADSLALIAAGEVACSRSGAVDGPAVSVRVVSRSDASLKVRESESWVGYVYFQRSCWIHVERDICIFNSSWRSVLRRCCLNTT